MLGYARTSQYIALIVALAAPTSTIAAEGAVRFPVFGGTVIPINSPVPVRYGSYEADETYRVHMESGSETATLSFKFHRKTQREGDALIQELRIVDLDVPYAEIPRKDMKLVKQLRIVLRSDAQGRVSDFDVAGLPADAPKMTPSEEAEFRREIRSFARSLPTLAAPTMKTGDVLTWMPTWENATGDDAEMAELFPQDPVPLIVQGYGFYEGSKVIVTSLLVDLPMAIPPEEGKGSLTMGGYALFDEATLAQLKSEIYAIFSSSSTSGERMLMNMQWETNARVTWLADREAPAPMSATPTLVGLAIQSSLDETGQPATYAFFDLRWVITNARAAGLSGKLVLLDQDGRERIAMPWSIAAGDVAKGSFTEPAVGFPIAQFGLHESWLRSVDVAKVRVRFEPNDPVGAGQQFQSDKASAQRLIASSTSGSEQA